MTPFRANAKYVALATGVVGLVTSRIGAAKLCLTKVASMPNSTLRDRMKELDYFGNIAHRYYFWITQLPAVCLRFSLKLGFMLCL